MPAGGAADWRRAAGVDDVAGDHPLARARARVERDERLARVDADANLELERRLVLVQLRDGVADRERRAHRALGVVLVRDRRAEDRDDRVADELLDRAAVALELVRAAARGTAREQRADVLRVEPLRPRRRADEVGEDDA